MSIGTVQKINKKTIKLHIDDEDCYGSRDYTKKPSKHTNNPNRFEVCIIETIAIN